MGQIVFQVVPGSDKEYVDAFDRIRAEGQFSPDKVTLGQLPELPLGELLKSPGVPEILAHGLRVFPNMTFRFGPLSVQIQRQPDKDSLFDRVTVNRPDNSDPLIHTKLVAVVQKHLGATNLLNVGNLLGPAAPQHFEAREIALARLEKMTSEVLEEMEAARKRCDEEFGAKERALEGKFD